MIKIIADNLELDYYTKADTDSIEQIKTIESNNRSNYFGDMDYLLENLECGYIIYIFQPARIAIGFLAISQTGELSMLIKKDWQNKGIGTKAVDLLTTVDKRAFKYYIDENNLPARSLEKRIFMISRL